MTRWPMLTVWGVLSLLVGCSSSGQVGLANAPRLGGTGLADERVHDAIANGGDACGGYAERGSLRGHVPRCPAPGHPSAAASWPGPPTESRVVPWLEHFYVGWPCAPATRAPRTTEPKSTAWATSVPPAKTACAVP